MTRDPMTLRARCYMTEEVMWTAPDAPLAKVLRRMNEERIRHVLVVSPAAFKDKGGDPIPEQAVVGILSSRDVLRKLEESPDAGIKLTGFAVHEVMTPKPLVTIGPDEDLAEAARLMLAKRISALPVLEEQEFIGILTTDDILIAGSLIEKNDDQPPV